MSKQLLIDCSLFEVSPQAIVESLKTNSGKLIVEGVLQRAGAKNQNGRVYPKDILEREVEKYKNTEIAQHRALGELDHPESSVVNLKNVSHNIVDCYWKGDDVIGRVEILTTPSGNILKQLLQHGIKLGISSRGLGSVKQLSEDGTLAVQDDFELICWDFVSNPSTHGAFMHTIKEGVNHTINKTITDSLISDILCELTGVCSIPKPCKCGTKCSKC